MPLFRYCSSKMETIFSVAGTFFQDHPTLGLLDHSPHQIQIVDQPFGQDLADGQRPRPLLGVCPRSCHCWACSSARVP